MVQKTVAGWNRKFSTTNPHLVPLPHARYCLAYQRFGMRGPRQQVFKTSKWLDSTIEGMSLCQLVGFPPGFVDGTRVMLMLVCNPYDPLTGNHPISSPLAALHSLCVVSERARKAHLQSSHCSPCFVLPSFQLISVNLQQAQRRIR